MRIKFLFFFTIFLCLNIPLNSVDFTWAVNSSSSRAWNDPVNWNAASFPNQGIDTASFNILNGISNVQLTDNYVISSLSISNQQRFITTINPANPFHLQTAVSISGSSTASFGDNFIFNAGTGNQVTVSDTSGLRLFGIQDLDTLTISNSARVEILYGLIGTDRSRIIASTGVAINGSGASLIGTGTIAGNVNLIEGVISPTTDTLAQGYDPDSSDAISTIKIDGNYTQQGSGQYNVQIDATGATDLIDITGTATLAGTVNLKPVVGVYAAGSTYTILSAAGGITNTFTTLTETHPLDFTLSYVGNNVILSISSNEGTSQVVSPVNLNQLSSNAQKMGTFLFIDPAVPNPVLSNPLKQNLISDVSSSNSAAIADLVNIVLASPASVFEDTLMQLTPIQTGAFTLVGLQNNIHMADIMSRRMIQTFCCQNLKSKKTSRKTSNCINKQRQAWVEPIGFYYHQNGRGFFREFDAYTYGMAYGMEFPLCDIATVNTSIGYTHTGIVWSPTFGNAYANSIYYNAAGGLSSGTAFLNFLLQGSVDFYYYTRKIHIPGLKRQAHSRHNSYNILARLQAGKKYVLNKKGGFFLQPEAEFNYLNLFQEGYKESGSGNTDLYVHYKQSVYLQPNFKIRLIKEFTSSSFCYNPNIYLGWLIDIPVNNSAYESGLYHLYPSHFTFKTDTYPFVTNQLVIGGQFSMTRANAFLFTAGFDADILSRMSIYTLSSRIEWNF